MSQAPTSLIRGFRALLGAEGVLSAPSEMLVYDCDGYTVERRPPIAVVFPRTTQEVADVVRLCRDHHCPIVARGAGTSLAGGCIPPPNGVVLMLTRMNRILEVRLDDSLALVEPGVLNIQLSRTLAGTSWHYAPDPSSQIASTIGGNVATNAGGPHTLKYGVTVNHLAGVEAVLSDGSIVTLGPVENTAALDLTSLLCGSEGTLGVVTRAWVRLTRDPEDRRTLRAAFPTVDAASQAVSQIIADGIIPAALELMDRGILDAVEDAYAMGVPRTAGAVLVIEVDGAAVTLGAMKDRIEQICRAHGVMEILHADTPSARDLLWKCRKMAGGAVGRLSPGHVVQDGVVPRSKLPEVMRLVADVSARHGIRIACLAHAGDGNVHPILLYDERIPSQLKAVHDASCELLEACIACGGSVTAEHGVGVEKIAFIRRLFPPADLEALYRIRTAFDPYEIFNPGKKLPSRAAGSVAHDSSTLTSEINNESSGDITDVAALMSAVQQANRNRTPIEPVGGGTSGAYATPSRPRGMPLATAQLNRVIDYSPDDMTITVEAGMTLAALNRHLDSRKQRLPLDPPDADRATIGGILASNAYGPRRFACGTARDYLLGVRMIDGRGQSYCAGSKVVKNVAGYHLAKAIVGSRGALGIITQATLMIRPAPTHSAFVSTDVASFDAARKMLQIVRQGATTPAAVELLAGRSRASERLVAKPDAAAARIITAFEGGEEEVIWMAERLMRDWQATGHQEISILYGTGLDADWASLSRPAAFQVNLFPSSIYSVAEALVRAAPELSIAAHAFNGVLRCSWADAIPPSDELRRIVCNVLRPIAVQAGGNLAMLAMPNPGVLPSAAEEAWTAEELFGDAPAGRTVMLALAGAFDPAGILKVDL